MKLLTELVKLNDKNLLAYFRAERKRFKLFTRECFLGSDHCDYIWDYIEGNESLKKKYFDWIEYLDLIKSLLKSRGHVSKNSHYDKNNKNRNRSKPYRILQ